MELRMVPFCIKNKPMPIGCPGDAVCHWMFCVVPWTHVVPLTGASTVAGCAETTDVTVSVTGMISGMATPVAVTVTVEL